ncbi:MAG: hypothetical protein HXY22_06090 [Alphaproteobacteria bacterium]|nr:hypothetical protein [Alphaproteobacteria bacterium]
MLRTIVLIFAGTLISGCAAQQLHRDIHNRAALEFSAWRMVEAMAPEKCGVPDRAPPRDKAVSISRCVSNLVNETVLPVALFPDEVIKFRRKAEADTEAYAAGNLSAAEREKRSKVGFEEYVAIINGKANQLLLVAQQRDIAFSNAMAGVANSLNASTNRSPSVNRYHGCGGRIPPIASPGCQYMCINGEFAEVC